MELRNGLELGPTEDRNGGINRTLAVYRIESRARSVTHELRRDIPHPEETLAVRSRTF